MFSEEMIHTVDKINSANIIGYPYTHIEVDNVFSDSMYNLMLENTIPSDFLYSLKDRGRVSASYSEGRLVTDLKPTMPNLPNSIREFWEDFSIWMHYSFKKIILRKFNLLTSDIKVDCLYTRDSKGFHLRPHADTNSKIVTALIYLPKNNNNLDIGTSIYTPKKEDFVCETGMHYNFTDFNLYKTVSYQPNKLFCFVKSNKSFHGLEPIKENVTRDLLIFDIQKA